jgi:uncharacterized protein YecE (DUF72 family)
LKNFLIGTGGWAYFRVPGIASLTAYSKIFNFVEVNSTFYQMPALREVEKWRRLVPPDFQFTVRAHRSITHTHKFQPVPGVFEAFDKIREICKALNAQIIHLQTPPALDLDGKMISDFRDLLSTVNLGNVRLALEVRKARSEKLPMELSKIMQENKVIHCVDLSKGEIPDYESDTLYTRLFGKGRHNIYQPTDEELEEVDHKASSSKAEKVVMSFHFVRMYKDAARLKTYKQTGKFPMVTRSTGITSLEQVLSEDAVFPATKRDLVSRQGWKLFDMSEKERPHLGEYLEKLPDGIYNCLADVTSKLESITR